MEIPVNKLAGEVIVLRLEFENLDEMLGTLEQTDTNIIL